MRYFKPALFLTLFAAIVPELLSGSTPLRGFFDFGLFSFLFVIGYGVPVLLIREFAVRNNLSLRGIVIAGLAYGIYNEGIIAKTFLLTTGVPIPQYDNYGHLFGIGVPWASTISVWHAFASVLFPILFIHALYPEKRAAPWIGKKTAIVCGAFLLLLVSTSFVTDMRVPGTPTQLGILLGFTAFLFLLAVCFRSKGEGESLSPPINWNPVFLGMSVFFFLFVILSAIAGLKVWAVVHLAVLILGIGGYYRVMERRHWLTPPHMVLFGIGCYIQSVFLGAFIRISQGSMVPDALVTLVVSLAALIWFARRIQNSEITSIGRLSN